MRGTGARWEAIRRRWCRPRCITRGIRWGGTGAGLALLLGGALGLGIGWLRHPAAPHRMGVRVALIAAPRTPFEASLAEAQGWYLRAQVRAKEQLESLEE